MTEEQKQATLDAIKDIIQSRVGMKGGTGGGQQPTDPRLNKPKPQNKDTQQSDSSSDGNQKSDDRKNDDQNDTEDTKGQDTKGQEKDKEQEKTHRKPQIGDTGDPDIQAAEEAERQAHEYKEAAKETAEKAKEAGEKSLQDKAEKLADDADKIGKEAQDLQDVDGTMSPKERARLQRIQDALHDVENQRKALDETERAVFTDAQLQADKKHRREYQDNPAQRFLHSVYKFIKDEVESVKMASWKRPDKRYSSTPIIHKGKAVNHNAPVPLLAVYFDKSGSIGPAEEKLCEQAIASLNQFVKRGELKIKIYYFSDDIFSDPDEAGGGTSATQKILDHAKEIHANNIIILTDSDMDSQGHFYRPLTVPGAVWFLFAKGQRCYKIMEYLHGRKLTKAYDLK